MAKAKKGFCIACKREGLNCDKAKPRCAKCKDRKVKCLYALKLSWGGRPYKNKKVESTLPNTVFSNGALVVKKNVLPGNDRSVKAKQFFRFDQSCHKTARDYPKMKVCDLKKTAPECLSAEVNASPEHIMSVQKVHYAPNNIYKIKMVNKDLSWEHMTLFKFFVEETCDFFVPIRSKSHISPYRTTLPRMAMHCSSLRKLVIAFGAKHRKMLSISEEENKYQSLDDVGDHSMNFESIGNELLKQALRELADKSMENADFNEETLAIALLMSNLHICFSDGRGDWRTHYHEAKELIRKKLTCEPDKGDHLISLREYTDPRDFLLRWYTYLDVIGLLSSVNLPSKCDQSLTPIIRFESGSNEILLRQSMEEMKDISFSNGMDIKVMAYLTQISTFLSQKSAFATQGKLHDFIYAAVKLDFEINDYLTSSEQERDVIFKEKFSDNTHKNRFPGKVKDYLLMRSINLVFGLSGVLQLRRRVLDMPSDAHLVSSLILQITNLIGENISVSSPSLPCLSFCLFTCGCELTDKAWDPYRYIYRERLDALWKKGLASALQARQVMEECWTSKLPWWQVLEKRNLDICFAI
ncbi:LAMI_0C00122g1_1 [Lachancea mirantina]|uniref:LAMI_0C00122g1_1 n=1 Tax=Lachancea mirantina TaxID=1230905 RepID=A0A1G4IZH5_9SACH|nr:LAMI_0C00122g1_1 [Lachancea mirantina]